MAWLPRNIRVSEAGDQAWVVDGAGGWLAGSARDTRGDRQVGKPQAPLRLPPGRSSVAVEEGHDR